MARLGTAILAACFLWGGAAHAGAPDRYEAQITALGDYQLESQRWQRLRLTSSLGLFWQPEGSPLTPSDIALAARARRDHTPKGKTEGEKTEVELRQASLQWTSDQLAVGLGIMEIAWGETFGLPIVDLVNPRDLSEGLYEASEETRMAQGMLDVRWLAKAGSVQLVFTPAAATPKVPRAVGGLAVTAERSHRPEAGLRAGWLFDFGLDVKLFHLRHLNRLPVYELALSPASGTARLALSRDEIFSTGLSWSFALNETVLRGDAVVHQHQPLSAPSGELVRGQLARVAIGGDYIGISSWTFGAQFMLDHRSRAYQPKLTARSLQWLGVRAARDSRAHQINPELIVMTGLSHTDHWIQPRLVARVGEHLSVALAADYFHGVPDSYFGPVKDADKIRCEITAAL